MSMMPLFFFFAFPFSSSPRSTDASPVSATFLASASDFENATGASSTGSKRRGGGGEEGIVIVNFVVVVAIDAFSFAPAEACCGSRCCCAAMGCRGPFILAL